MLWIESAHVQPQNCVCLEGIEKSTLFKIKPVDFWTKSHEVNVASGRMVY